MDKNARQGKERKRLRVWAALEKYAYMKFSSILREVRKNMLSEETVVVPFRKLCFRIT